MSILLFCKEHIYDIITIVLGITFTTVSWHYSRRHRSEQLRSYVPTIWTSLGIFFTFLSIYLTLSGMAKLDDDEISISKIIGGIIPAFSTSVIGILGAIFTAYIDKWKKSQSEASDNIDFEKFNNGESPSKGLAQTPDLILLELVRKINSTIYGTQDILRASTMSISDALQASTSTLSEQFELQKAEIIMSFRDTLIEQKDQLQFYVESFITEANSTHSQQIKDILKQFEEESQKREDQHSALIREFAETARTNNNWIKDTLCEESVKRQKEIEEFLTKERAEIGTYITTQNGLMTDVLQQSKTALEDVVNRIQELFENDIKRNIEDFAKVQYENCVDLIETEYNSFYENSEKVLATQESENANFLEVLSGAIKQAFDGMTNDISLLKDSIAQHLTSLFDENKDSLANLMSKHKEEFDAISNSIKNTFEAEKEYIATATQEMEESYSTILKKYQDELENTASSISLSANNLLTTISSTISETEKSMASDIERFCHDLGEKTSILGEEHLNVVKGINAKEEAIINEASGKLTDNITSLISTIQELRSAVQTSVNDYADKHNAVKKQIAETTASLIKEVNRIFKDSSQVEVLENTCINLNGQLNDTIGALDNKYAVIAESLESVSASISAYSRIAEDTKSINQFVNSTIHLFREHSTQMATLESSLKDMADSITNAVKEIKKTSSSSRQESKSVPKVEK